VLPWPLLSTAARARNKRVEGTARKDFIMEQLQRQLNILQRQLGDAEESGRPVVAIQRQINTVMDNMTALRTNATMLHNAPRCQVEESGDMLWA